MTSGGDYGEIGGMKIGSGTEVLGENLPQRHFVQHKSHMTRPGFKPGPPLWEASDKPLELWRGLVTFLVSTLKLHKGFMNTFFYSLYVLRMEDRVIPKITLAYNPIKQGNVGRPNSNVGSSKLFKKTEETKHGVIHTMAV
jgi:hypothetical protein